MYQVASTYERRRSLPALVLVTVVWSARLAAAVGSITPTSRWLHRLGVVVAVAAWFVGDSVRVRRIYVAGLAEQAAQRQREVGGTGPAIGGRRAPADRPRAPRRRGPQPECHRRPVRGRSPCDRRANRPRPRRRWPRWRPPAARPSTSCGACSGSCAETTVTRRSLAPAPGVAALDPLMRAGPLGRATPSISTSDSTAVGALSPSVELSIYRIIQEALTNVVKHAGPARVQVEIRDDDDALVLEVNDDGRGLSPGRSTEPIDADEAGPPRHRRDARAGGALRRVPVGRAPPRGRLPGARPAFPSSALAAS